MKRPCLFFAILLAALALDAWVADRSLGAEPAARVQIIYAVTPGARDWHLARQVIPRTVRLAQIHLRAQTGMRLRIGSIRTVRLPIRLPSGPVTPDLWQQIEQALPAASGTINVVFLASARLWFGGRSSWPPLVAGHTSIVSTGVMPLPGGGFDPGTLWQPFLHETFHALGLVPKDAPHSDGAGHVTDSTTDLMAPRAGETIDCGHDDYYATLLASPYLERG